MVCLAKENIMNKDWFVAPQEWVNRSLAMAEEWQKLEGKGIEQASAMVDEMAKLTKESLTDTSRKSWQK